MSQFRDAYDEFRREGVEVAALSVDSPYSHRAWAESIDIRYPLISDFNREFMEKYRVPLRGMRLLSRVAGRSAFIVDQEGVIRYAWYQPEGRALPPVQEILEAARSLPSGPGS